MADDGAREFRWANTRSLDTASVVRVARQIVAAEGFAALSMRAIARKLDVSPMAAYRHVGDKNSLVALLVDDVLTPVQIPGPDFGSRDERLLELGRRGDDAMSACPGIQLKVFTVRPTEQGWRLMNGYVQILLDASFSEREAALGFSILHAHALGRAALEDAITARPPTERRSVDPPASAPAMRRIRTQWPQLHRADFRAFAHEVVLAGLHDLRRIEAERS
ncbi:TetR/AcrR family transcriptional regulator [uncultured Jatrophihabitans sp.]|uniref:TetR/AcrR family transcriptional regulator n=1 Tax=uncultured Jatrophihabitans sp. TaxID=1610747 RepID=UPI0035CCA225